MFNDFDVYRLDYQFDKKKLIFNGYQYTNIIFYLSNIQHFFLHEIDVSIYQSCRTTYKCVFQNNIHDICDKENITKAIFCLIRYYIHRRNKCNPGRITFFYHQGILSAILISQSTKCYLFANKYRSGFHINTFSISFISSLINYFMSLRSYFIDFSHF